MLISDQKGLSTKSLGLVLVTVALLFSGFIYLAGGISKIDNEVGNFFDSEKSPCQAVRDLFNEIGLHLGGSEDIWVPVDDPYTGDNNTYPDDGFDRQLKLEKTPISYSINPQNDDGLPRDAVIREVRYSFETWDAHTSVELFNNEISITTKSGFVNDGKNVVSFAPLSDQDAVGLTKTWIEDGKVVEFDIVLNSRVDWGIDPDDEGPQQIRDFDIQNIATHEVGHTLVLKDLYEDQYFDLTMYYRAKRGGTKKISLESGDIQRLQDIYGA